MHPKLRKCWVLRHYYVFICQLGKHKKNQFSHRIGAHFVKIGLQILLQNHFFWCRCHSIVFTLKSKWTVYVAPIPDVIWASLSAFWNFLLMEYNVLTEWTDTVLWESSSCSLHSVFSGVWNIFSFCLSIDLGHLEFLINHGKRKFSKGPYMPGISGQWDILHLNLTCISFTDFL